MEMLESKVAEASAAVTSAAEVGYDSALDATNDAFSVTGDAFQSLNDDLNVRFNVNLNDFEGFVQQSISFAGDIVSEVNVSVIILSSLVMRL